MIHVFIYNPETGDDNFGEKLRAHLKERSDKTDGEFSYYVFTSRWAGNETELARFVMHIFQEEELRIYCCGGSGTLRNVVAGIDNLESVELAFYPCGLTNDLLKCFGDQQADFSNLDALIDGRAISIDYINTNLGPSLNIVSLGLDAKVIRGVEGSRGFTDLFRGQIFKNLPYVGSLITTVLFIKRHHYEMTINSIPMRVRASEIVFASGCVMGGFLKVKAANPPVSGLARYMVVMSGFGLKLTKVIKSMVRGDESMRSGLVMAGDATSMTIKRKDGESFDVSMDGEIVSTDYLDIQMVRGGINFVLPRGGMTSESV